MSNKAARQAAVTRRLMRHFADRQKAQRLERDISGKLESLIEEMEGQPPDEFKARLQAMPDDQRVMLLIMIDSVTKGPPDGLKRLAALKERIKQSREPANNT